MKNTKRDETFLRETRHVIERHIELYPKCEPDDIVKLLYQSEFGCGHFAPDDAEGYALLLQELETARPGQHLMEKVGGGGNRSAAAAQFAGTDVNTAVKRIYAAIDDYLG